MAIETNPATKLVKFTAFMIKSIIALDILVTAANFFYCWSMLSDVPLINLIYPARSHKSEISLYFYFSNLRVFTENKHTFPDILMVSSYQNVANRF